MHIKHTTESEIPSNKWQTTTIPVANPDLQIRPQFGRKNKGGGGGGGTGPPRLSPGFIQALSPYKKFTSCKAIQGSFGL